MRAFHHEKSNVQKYYKMCLYCLEEYMKEQDGLLIFVVFILFFGGGVFDEWVSYYISPAKICYSSQ